MKQSGNNLLIQTKRHPTESAGNFIQNTGKDEFLRKELSKIFSRAQTCVSQSSRSASQRYTRLQATPYQQLGDG